MIEVLRSYVPVIAAPTIGPGRVYDLEQWKEVLSTLPNPLRMVMVPRIVSLRHHGVLKVGRGGLPKSREVVSVSPPSSNWDHRFWRIGGTSAMQAMHVLVRLFQKPNPPNSSCLKVQ